MASMTWGGISRNGLIRWLRPEYQTKPKAERKATQATLGIALPEADADKAKGAKTGKAKSEPKPAWPSDLLEQTQAVRAAADALQSAGKSVAPETVAAAFTRAPRARVQEILQALSTLGFITLFESEPKERDA